MTDEAPKPFIIRIAKANKDLEVQFADFPPEVKRYIVEQGLSKLLNAATAKETKELTPDDATREANSMAHATKKLDNLKAGQISTRGKKSVGDGKVPQNVMTEARRQAMIVIKAKIIASGKKIGQFSTKAKTEAANDYLKNHPGLVTAAQDAINAAEAMAAAAEFDVSNIPVDAKLIAKNEAKKAAAKAATAAKNAGKPGPQKSAIKTQTKLPPAPKRAPAEVHAQA